MKPEWRTLVIKLGPAGIDVRPFEGRDLGLEQHTEKEARDLLKIARGLIIAEPPAKFQTIQYYFRTLLPLAEQHGLVIRILVHSEDARNQVTAIRQAQKDGRCWSVQSFLPDELPSVAQAMLQEYVSPRQVSSAEIDPPTSDLTSEQRILLRRAFFDSSNVRLDKLGGGKASDRVFLVNAWREGGVAPRPLPFFAKFATRKAIEKERENYRIWAEPYVPFYLRPNLDHRRCVRGSKSSALVGNLVEHALPLREALRKGVAEGVIFGLFEITLKGFRNQPFTAGGAKQTAGLDEFIRSCIKVEQFEKCGNVVDLAQQIGLHSDPLVMEERLRNHAAGIAYWQAPAHRDLHDGNVMVRRNDAIVIDFGSMRSEFAPLTADPAALEVSLLFRTDPADQCAFDEWESLICAAYDCVPRIRPPNPESGPTSVSWLHRAVREVRHILFGCDCTEKEGAVVLAAYLMRFARLPLEQDEPLELRYLTQRRHAYALVIAQLVIDAL